jgi:hypothetical protein
MKSSYMLKMAMLKEKIIGDMIDTLTRQSFKVMAFGSKDFNSSASILFSFKLE